MSTPILLPLSQLQKYNACDLKRRIADFELAYGHPPTETSTFREWLDITPLVREVVWALRCLPRHVARDLSIRARIHAASRHLASGSTTPRHPSPSTLLRWAELYRQDPDNLHPNEVRDAEVHLFKIQDDRCLAATYAAIGYSATSDHSFCTLEHFQWALTEMGS